MADFRPSSGVMYIGNNSIDFGIGAVITTRLLIIKNRQLEIEAMFQLGRWRDAISAIAELSLATQELHAALAELQSDRKPSNL